MLTTPERLALAWPRRPTDPIIDFKADRRSLRPVAAVAMRDIDGAGKRVQRLFGEPILGS